MRTDSPLHPLRVYSCSECHEVASGDVDLGTESRMNIFRKLFGSGPAKRDSARATSLSGVTESGVAESGVTDPTVADETLLRPGGSEVEAPPVVEKLTDTSPAGMVRAITEGLEACFLLLATAPGGESRTMEGITVAITGLPFFLFNGVFRTRLDSRLPTPEIDRRIGEVVAYLRSRGAPFGWWLMPDEDPPDLRARLVAQDFAPAGEQPGMAIALDQLEPAPRPPKDVAVAEVIDVEGIREHMRLVASGSGLPPEFELTFGALLQELPFGPGKPIRYFLARERGKPIGTSLVVLSGRAAGIFSVATTPEARGRGVGTVVTLAALHAAREAGHRIAILESSQMGYNVYRRLGFEEYGQIGHFAWTGAADS